MAIINAILLYPLLTIKDLEIVIKSAGYGAAAVYLYLIFILYIFIENIYNGNLKNNLHNIEILNISADSISTIIGNFALAFMAHNAVSSVMSKNKNKGKN